MFLTEPSAGSDLTERQVTRSTRDYEMASVTTDGMGRLLGDGSESSSSSNRQYKRKRQHHSDDESQYDDAQTSNDDARTSNDDARAAGIDRNSNEDEIVDDDQTANNRINLSADFLQPFRFF